MTEDDPWPTMEPSETTLFVSGTGWVSPVEVTRVTLPMSAVTFEAPTFRKPDDQSMHVFVSGIGWVSLALARPVRHLAEALFDWLPGPRVSNYIFCRDEEA